MVTLWHSLLFLPLFAFTGDNLITLIGMLLGGGGLVAVFTLTERKSKAQIDNVMAQIDNMSKSNDLWQEIVAQKEADLVLQRQMITELNARIESKDLEINQLHIKVNNLGHQVTVNKIYRCDKVECSSRKPPLISPQAAIDSSTEG